MNDPQPDNRDKTRELNASDLAATAREIASRHTNMIESRDKAIHKATTACEQAFEISTLVSRAHASLGGRRFAQWWEDQKLPVGWAKTYLTLSRTPRGNALGDKDQMRLIGILPSPDTHNDGQQSKTPNPLEWLKWCGKIKKNFDGVAVRELDEADRRAALTHLQPIKQIINELEEGLNAK